MIDSFMYLDTNHKRVSRILKRILKRRILDQIYINNIRETLIIRETYNYYLKDYQYYNLTYNKRVNKRLLNDRVITRRRYKNSIILTIRYLI